MSYKFAIDNST